MTLTIVQSAFPAPSITPDELAEGMDSENRRMFENISYLYTVHNHVLDATRIAEGGIGPFDRMTHLFERKGERFRMAQAWSGRHDDAEGARTTSAGFIQVTAYDGTWVRTNLIPDGWYKPIRDQLLSPLSDVSSLKRVLNIVPAGKQNLPHGNYSEPNSTYVSDSFAEAFFMSGDGQNSPSLPVIFNEAANLKEMEDGTVQVEGTRWGPPEWIASRWNISIASAEAVARQSRFRIRVDPQRGFRIVHSLLTHGPQHRVEIKDIELKKDDKSGFWYPARFTRLEHGSQINEFELSDISFDPVPDDSFERVWVDGQRVVDRKTKREYVLNPRWRDPLEQVAKAFLQRIGVMGGTIRPIRWNVPAEVRGTANRWNTRLVLVLLVGTVAIVVCFAALWRSFRKQEVARSKP